MKKMLLITLVFVIVAVGFAAEINVEAGDFTITNAIASAADGDIINLITDGGVYRDTSIYLTKSITIQGDENLTIPPVWKMNQDVNPLKIALIKCDTVDKKTDFTLKNVKLDLYDEAKITSDLFGYRLMQGGSFIPNDLTITDCEFEGGVQAIASFANDLSFDNVHFSNCLFHKHEKVVINLRGDGSGGNPAAKGLVKVENCTFYDCTTDAAGGIFVSGSTPDGVAICTSVIDHCTFDNLKFGVDYRYLTKDSEVKNCSFSNINGRPGNIKNQAEGDSVSIHHINIWQNSKPLNSNQMWVVGQYTEVDPMYTDPDNGDFTLQEGSPLLGTADDGLCIGDLRWNRDDVAIDDNIENAATRFALEQNYPNPFNPETTIEFSLEKASTVKLSVFDTRGNEIEVLKNGHYNAGTYRNIFHGTHYPSGLYFYKLQVGNEIFSKKMLLLK